MFDVTNVGVTVGGLPPTLVSVIVTDNAADDTKLGLRAPFGNRCDADPVLDGTTMVNCGVTRPPGAVVGAAVGGAGVFVVGPPPPPPQAARAKTAKRERILR